MGVNGLWTVLQPCARPTNLATLNRKRLAVDASIWIYQFLKAVRDKEGNALRNSHVVGFFRRICKLLWFGIRPVFVFDGGAPQLKRATLQGRRRRREGRREDAVRTAGKLLAVQMQRLAEEEDGQRKRRRENIARGADVVDAEEEAGVSGVAAGEVIPSAENIVYAEEATMSRQERQKSRKFYKQDAYHLPEMDANAMATGRPEDPRVMSVEELEEYARQFHEGEDINLYDFSKIDFDGDFFKSLPPADRYNILNAARLRSRLRMGLSKEQLDEMFPNRMDFSKFQIERVKERNNLTQRLMAEVGMTGTDMTIGGNGRIAGEKNREYILVKNDGAEGGWALGVVSTDKEIGERHKPIDVDALQIQFQKKEEDSDEDEEFEDVPIPGLNRLPRLHSQQDGQANLTTIIEDDEAMFVDGNDDLLGKSNNNLDCLFGDNHEISEQDGLVADEEEDINRAIAMSLKSQHGVGQVKDRIEMEQDDSAEVPTWNQKAVEAAKPITTSNGRMVAHIVNNRANASVPKPSVQKPVVPEPPAPKKPQREERASDDSDSDDDLQAALAAARRKRQAEEAAAPTPPRPNVKNPFDGPLPFEPLNWKRSLAKKPAEQPKPQPQADGLVATPPHEPDSDAEEAGGFVVENPAADEEGPKRTDKPEAASKGKDKEEPRPLPPWLVDDTDMREKLQHQVQAENQINAEDREIALEEERLRQKRLREERVVEIDSSDDDGSDIEIIEAPPQKATSIPLDSAPADGLVAVAEDAPEPAAQTVIAVPNGHESPPWASAEESEDEEEFEDVVTETAPPSNVTLTLNVTAESDEPAAKPSGKGDIADEFEGPEESADVPPEMPPIAQQDRVEGIAPVPESGVTTEDPYFDDFSDPEEEELLAQMAEEAEEHARFASTLNHKPTAENQASYEAELKALRTQQKKDRRDADEVTQIMVTECQALLRLFGIPYITAPMEAEAQCAELVSLGLVDGIVTDDSDIFLFGGTRVYKNMFNGNKFVECYLSQDLERDLSLGRAQLIAIAQLLGSDYTEGLPGIGPVTAVEILSEFSGAKGLEDFANWWADVQAQRIPVSADAKSTFRRKFRKSQATKLFLPPGFPSPAVPAAYEKPDVDSDPAPFQWGVPDLDALRTFLMATIGWSQERTDEVLVPVIRDMNRREEEGTQANITRFFSGGVGAGAKEAFAPRQRTQKGSKRMELAVEALRAKKKAEAMAAAGGTDEDGVEAVEDDGEDAAVSTAGESSTSRRKRKATASRNATDEAADDDDDDDVVPQPRAKRSRAKKAKNA